MQKEIEIIFISFFNYYFIKSGLNIINNNLSKCFCCISFLCRMFVYLENVKSNVLIQSINLGCNDSKLNVSVCCFLIVTSSHIHNFMSGEIGTFLIN